MKIVNLKNQVLSASFVIGIILIVYLVCKGFFSSNQTQLSFDYAVEQDEVCSEIANTFGISAESIIKLNNLKSDCSDIYPGQTLLIPYPVPTITPAGFVSPTQFAIADCETVRYTVKLGDTLEIIAKEYNVPVKFLIDYNGIVDEKIAVNQGDKLVIPLFCYPIPGYMDPTSVHTPEPIFEHHLVACGEVELIVLEGDTLDTISLNYAIPKKYIMDYNHMNTEEVLPGITLLIPMCYPMPTPTVTPVK